MKSHIKIYQTQQKQSGITLAEVLVTLVIISFVMVGSGMAFKKLSPRWALDNATIQLVTDLKRARLRAGHDNQPILLVPSTTGYHINDLNLTRAIPRGVTIQWPKHVIPQGENQCLYDGRKNASAQCGIIINNITARIDLKFMLRSSLEESTIIMERLTGRIHVQ